ncbi:nuclease HARBI1-like protein, partial [Thalictrum thalictroides]
KYYLVDAGYTHCKGFLAPFRRTRYHLTEFDDQNPNPTTPAELFNHRHSSLRNTVERAFGILKQRWKILDDSKEHFDYDTQVDIVLACCILDNHIMRVDPNDPLINQVQDGSEDNEQQQQEDEEEEEVVLAQATRLTRLTRREQRDENKRWKEFRMKMVNDMWAQN